MVVFIYLLQFLSLFKLLHNYTVLRWRTEQLFQHKTNRDILGFWPQVIWNSKCYFLWSANAEEIALSGLKQMILVIDFTRTEGFKELSRQVILRNTFILINHCVDPDPNLLFIQFDDWSVSCSNLQEKQICRENLRYWLYILVGISDVLLPKLLSALVLCDCWLWDEGDAKYSLHMTKYNIQNDLFRHACF